MTNALGTPTPPRFTFARSKPRAPRVGQHLPRASELNVAFDRWQRSQPIKPGSAYYAEQPKSARNPNPKTL